MDERELKLMREKPQVISNILNEDFDFKWDWKDYTIKKWETQTHAYYLAEHCSLHMARKYCTLKKLNYNKEVGKIVDKIMGKEFIEYNQLTMDEAKELCKKREISLSIDWKKKNKAQLIQDLKNTH